jgi:hypothetical protein
LCLALIFSVYGGSRNFYVWTNGRDMPPTTDANAY